MFWGEAVLCAIYIHNRCPSTAINNKSPYELWYNHLPVLQHFRVFGSPCYELIPKQQRDKLGERSHKFFSWGILIPPELIDCMMRKTRNLLFQEMLFFSNLLKMLLLLISNSIIWIDSLPKSFIKNGIMISHILKGGFIF